RPTIFDRHVLALDKSLFLQTLLECRHDMHEPWGRRAAKKANHRYRSLLCPRRERPRRRAAEQRDEIAPAPPIVFESVLNRRRRPSAHADFHSIISSARASSVGGTSRPRTFAVVRLMTRSNLVGCSTGISAGFAPRRILST